MKKAMERHWKITTLLSTLLLAVFLVGCDNGEDSVATEEIEEVHEYEEAEEIAEVAEVEEVEELEVEEPEVEEEPEPEECEEIEAAYEEEEEVTGVYVLIGTWVKEDDESIEYIFEADGTGTRTTPGMEGGFTWRQLGDRDDGVHLSSNYDSGRYGQELWLFTVEDDILIARKSTLDNERNLAEFRYIRVSP